MLAKLTSEQQKHIEKHVTKHMRKHTSTNLLSKAEYLQSQFKQHVSTAIIAAFSFLIALAWKDLIVHAVGQMISEDMNHQIPYLSDLLSAIIVTIIAIIGIALVTNWAKKPEVLVSETKTK